MEANSNAGSSENESQSGVSGLDLLGKGLVGDIHGRQKLKSSFNLRDFLANREGEFEVDVDAMQASQSIPSKKPKGIFDSCDFKNYTVDCSDEDSGMVMFADFDKLASTMTNVTPDGGIKKKVVKAGLKGQFPPANAKVYIYYNAICENWDEVVDNVSRPGKPKSFKIGRGEVLAVLDIGITTMELHEVAKFLASPNYAYGMLGLIDRVPPNSNTLFTVELVEFIEVTAVESIFKLSTEERAEMDFKEIEKAALEMKFEGNRFCKDKNWDSAISKYRKGVKVLDRYVTVQKSADRRRNELLFILYTNLSQCYLNNEEYQKAMDAAKLALDLPPGTEGNKCKAYYRQGKACYELGRFEEAQALVKEALRLKPSDEDVKKFFEVLCRRLEKDNEVGKDLSKRMMSGLNLN